MVLRKIGEPFLALRLVELSAVGATDHARQIVRDHHRVFAVEMLDIKLDILRHQFPQDDRFIEQPCGKHALAEIGRQRLGPGNDTFRIVARHLRSLVSRRSSRNSFFKINQTECRGITGANPREGGKAQSAERTAPLDPVCGIHKLDRVFVIATFKVREHFPGTFFAEEAFDASKLFVGQSSKSLSEGDLRLNTLDPFLGKMPPAASHGLTEDSLNLLRPVGSIT
jgi:hypothetical protein